MTLGEVVELEEKFFSVVTALSGAGPAYVYLMIEALIDGSLCPWFIAGRC